MSDQTDREYRIESSPLAIVRGGQSKALVRLQSKEIVKRKTHDLVLHATADGYAQDPRFHWLGDLRRGQLRIYGALLRFIDLCATKDPQGRRRAPKWMIKMIPGWIDEYIENAYDGDDPGPGVRETRAA